MSTTKSFLSYYPNRVAKAKEYSTRLRTEEQFRRNNPYWWWRERENDKSWAAEVVEEIDKRDFRDWQRWKKAGSNLFDFSSGLLEMLSHTDASLIQVKDLRLPYPCIYLDLTVAELHFVQGHSAKVEGVYIIDESPLHIDEDFSIDQCFALHFVGDHAGHFDHLYTCDGFEGLHRYSLSSNDDSGKQFTIADALDDELQMRRRNDEWDVEHVGDSPTLLAERLELYESFISRSVHLVVNCLLYLMLPDKDMQHQQIRPDVPLALQKRLEKANTKAKRKAAEADINSLGFTRVNYVGQSILPRAERTATAGSTLAPHWRRGHWRNQRHGEGRQAQRLTWIQPVVVNKTSGEPNKGRIYTVQPVSSTIPTSPTQ